MRKTYPTVWLAIIVACMTMLVAELVHASHHPRAAGAGAAADGGAVRQPDALVRLAQPVPADEPQTAAAAVYASDVSTPFMLLASGVKLNEYADFAEAVDSARGNANAAVYYRDTAHPLWSNASPLAAEASVDGVPMIYQMPELERGCEVTSLAMLLGYAGIDVDKMTLADEIVKDPTPYAVTDDGEVYFGNPNDGFVGDMATFAEPGLGVYHGPVKELAERYAPGQVVDMTGTAFNDVLYAVSTGAPVWIIANMDYVELPDDMFETWQTPTGEVRVTYREHSLVVTGYDADTVALNDPIEGQVRVARADFAAAWEQMGKQAIRLVK